MFTLYDIEKAFLDISRAAEAIEVKGTSNIKQIIFIVNKCEDTVKQLEEVLKQMREEKEKNENETNSLEGDADG